jgi:hypothetical protein
VFSLGHGVLIPALIGGNWGRDLDMSANGSPYLDALVALHAATAAALGIVATTDAREHRDTLGGVALDPRLGAIARRLAGMPLRVWGGEVLVKNPGDNGSTGLHDDEAFALLDSRITLNAWVALIDVPVERGCLTFLPGSHRRGGQERIDPTQPSLSDVAREDADSDLFTYWPQLRWSPRVTVPLRAGDVTFHQRRTVHLAGANTASEARVSMLITFTDAEATYRPLPGHDPLPYQAGQRLPTDAFPSSPDSADVREHLPPGSDPRPD